MIPVAELKEEYCHLNAHTQKGNWNDQQLFRTALKSENYNKKNRYSDVLPLDSHRVKLSTLSDYINASHVGSNFICAQAPLPTSFEDFWRMVYEQKVSLIIALNREIEKGRLKGDIYWPNTHGERIQYSEFIVCFDSSFSIDEHELIVRKFELRHRMNHAPPRQIVQIQYLGWPDFGVPESTDAIREVMGLRKYYLEKGRLQGLSDNAIVHCSAGIGRTGTFVAAVAARESPAFERLVNDPVFKDIIYRNEMQQMGLPAGYIVNRPTPQGGWLRTLHHFDIPNLILSHRKQRNSGMVQTEDQYVFLHKILLDELFASTRKEPSSAVLQAQNFELRKKSESSSTFKSSLFLSEPVRFLSLDTSSFTSLAPSFNNPNSGRVNLYPSYDNSNSSNYHNLLQPSPSLPFPLSSSSPSYRANGDGNGNGGPRKRLFETAFSGDAMETTDLTYTNSNSNSLDSSLSLDEGLCDNLSKDFSFSSYSDAASEKSQPYSYGSDPFTRQHPPHHRSNPPSNPHTMSNPHLHPRENYTTPARYTHRSDSAIATSEFWHDLPPANNNFPSHSSEQGQAPTKMARFMTTH